MKKEPHDKQNIEGGAPELAQASEGISENPLAKLQEEAAKAKDQYLRTLADLENTRKRLHREKEEFVRFAAESMVRELLPVLDSLDNALVAVDKQSDPQAVIKGVHLIYRQLLGVLSKEGVKRIATIGETFDPNKHEAIAHLEATDAQQDNQIVEEVQVGYTMHDRLIRPAMVKVARQAEKHKQANDKKEINLQDE